MEVFDLTEGCVRMSEMEREGRGGGGGGGGVSAASSVTAALATW